MLGEWITYVMLPGMVIAAAIGWPLGQWIGGKIVEWRRRG